MVCPGWGLLVRMERPKSNLALQLCMWKVKTTMGVRDFDFKYQQLLMRHSVCSSHGCHALAGRGLGARRLETDSRRQATSLSLCI